MVLSVRRFQDGLVSGKVGIANLILDHDSGKLRARPAWTRRTPREQQKAEKDINDVGNDEVKEEPEETAYHHSNVAERKTGVNAARRLLVFLEERR